MRFEWDEVKNQTNRRKHGISFELAHEAFADPFCLTFPELHTESEERFWTIGRIGDLTIIVVAHTLRDDSGEEVVRMISARKATPTERRVYEENDE
jgi:uncharacterized DUF497 family protein